jgi:hypothetical protein
MGTKPPAGGSAGLLNSSDTKTLQEAAKMAGAAIAEVVRQLIHKG